VWAGPWPAFGSGMRPLPQMRETERIRERSVSSRRDGALAFALLALGAWTLGCGGGGAGSVTPPPPPPPSITVSVTPVSGTVLLGETLNLSASVSGTPDTAVTWSVNGTLGGSAQAGTISADGVYRAPADLPAGGTVQVTATSQADTSRSATAKVTVTSDISLSVSPNAAGVELGATQTFQAPVVSQGLPDTTVRWSLTGASCPNSCGAIDVNGHYTAPQILPGSATVTVVATSAADLTKQSRANVTVTSHFTVQIAAPSNLQAGGTATLTATLTPVPGSDPSIALSWSLQGSGCTGSACGVLSVTTTQSAGGIPISDAAVYTAPVTPPQPNTVLITVTPQADPTKAVQANITIQQGASISITPPTATLAANHRTTLTAFPSGLASGTLNWAVNGVPGGNTTYGQICVAGSNPCQMFSSGSAIEVDYLAPGSIPSPNPVSVTVSSAAIPSLSAAAQITVLNHVLVSVLPSTAQLPPMGVQAFSASVLGTSNQNVIWQVQGTGCGTAGACGLIDAAGTYTAPVVAPTPNAFVVVALSQDDPSQSGGANVSISTGPNILSLHPASVYAGGTNGFTLRADGSGFIPSSPGPGSTLFIGGTARTTSCVSANSCSAPVTETDVAQAGNLTVTLRNPDQSSSNTTQLVIVQPGSTDDVISLSASGPAATGKDIVVVEPTTAGIDSSGLNLDMEVAAIGTFNTTSNTCNLAGNPIPLIRPGSGSGTVDICLFSQAGFDTSMTYTVSGPGDVAVIAKLPAGLGIIHLTLQIPSIATPGARTLFIQNANLDRTAASGVLQIR
jgi:hypothetical protein